MPASEQRCDKRRSGNANTKRTRGNFNRLGIFRQQLPRLRRLICDCRLSPGEEPRVPCWSYMIRK
jgi:hypothetical protein